MQTDEATGQINAPAEPRRGENEAPGTDAPGIDPARDAEDDLAQKLERVKGEVDALQIAVMADKKPWYRDMATIISVLAFLFSFGTTVESYRRTKVQDIQNQRAELRSMLQRLASLPKDNFEATLKYAGNPVAIATLGGYVNQENAILVRQAAEMARGLPPGKVSATEYYAIALAMQNSYNLVEAKEFLFRAIESAREFNDEIAARRTYANLLFITGQPDAGRIEYQKALDIFSNPRYSDYNDYTRNSTHIWTELNWGYSEAGIGLSRLALQHAANAEAMVSRLIPGPTTEQIRNQVNQAKQDFQTSTLPPTPRVEPLPAFGSAAAPES